MVHAVICPLASSSENKELVLLEFQGSFDTGEEPTVQNVKIGDIHFENDIAYLVIGHQRVEGKKVKLAKPFAVIKKRPKNDEHRMDIDDDDDDETRSSSYYDTVAILREKYVFTQRPSLMVHETLRGLTRIGG